ncbi:hypothetical protein GOBAR_DD03496 [Gossypium barbadense]|nr:hypothetical protein GOBAR_DD03496 [Gossypium barbadense]
MGTVGECSRSWRRKSRGGRTLARIVRRLELLEAAIRVWGMGVFADITALVEKTGPETYADWDCWRRGLLATATLKQKGLGLM